MLQSQAFLDRRAYFETLISTLEYLKSGDTVHLATMDFHPGDAVIARLVKALATAAQNGANIYFAIDAYSLLLDRHYLPGPLLYSDTTNIVMPLSHQKVLRCIKRLKAAGVHVTMLNQPDKAWRNPFAGRSHIKFAVINQTVWLGGCNLTSHKEVDLMVQVENPVLARLLTAISQKTAHSADMCTALGGNDFSVALNNNLRLYADVGKPDSSIIYERAMQLIDESAEFVFVSCQLFPNGRTADHLKRAQKRGVKVVIVFNHPLKHQFPFNVVHPLVTAYEELGSPHHFFDYQLPLTHAYMHAKLLYTDAGTMTGSHNYLPSGVKFGTAEMALLSTDPAFGAQAFRALRNQIRPLLPDLPTKANKS